MKNPENKPLRIVDRDVTLNRYIGGCEYRQMLNAMLIAESNLVRAGKESAMPHFLAIVKEMEEIFRFKFEVVEERRV